MKDSLFFHEDFFREIELIPEENYFAMLKGHGKGKSQQDLHGFYSIKERENQKIKTLDLNIDFDSVHKSLKNYIVQKFDTVTTGYSSSIVVRPNTIALGFERIGIFFELTTTGVVQNIWLCQSADLPKFSISNNLFNSLVILGQQYNLVLVDWNEEAVIRLSAPEAVMEYLNDTFAITIVSHE